MPVKSVQCPVAVSAYDVYDSTVGHLGADSGILSYRGDIIVFHPTFETHLTSLEQLFAGFQAAGLTLKPSKVQLGQKEIEYLGHAISAKYISVSTERITAIGQLPTPKCTKDLR